MYLVVELQKNGDTLSNIPFAYSDYNQAMSKYHSLLSVAATSNVEKHAVSMLEDTGRVVHFEWFEHINMNE